MMFKIIKSFIGFFLRERKKYFSKVVKKFYLKYFRLLTFLVFYVMQFPTLYTQLSSDYELLSFNAHKCSIFSHRTGVVLTGLKPGHEYYIEINEFRGDDTWDGLLEHGTEFEIRTCQLYFKIQCHFVFSDKKKQICT